MNDSNKEKLITKIFWHSFYDLKTIEAFLEDMAANGYMFVSRNDLLFRFKRCEPVKVKFFVDIFHPSKVDDSLGTMRNEYISYCEECNWHYISNDNYAYFFYTLNDDATPIQTDDELRLNLINRHALRIDGLCWIIWLLLIIINFCIIDWSDLTRAFIEDFPILIIYSIYPVIVIPDILRYAYFYFKNRNRVKDGTAILFYSANNTFAFYYTRTLIAICVFLALTFIMSSNIYVAIGAIIAAIIAMIITTILRIHKGKKAGFSRMTSITFNMYTNMIIAAISTILVIFLPIFDILDIKHLRHYNNANQTLTTINLSKDDLPFTLSTLNAAPNNAHSEDRSAFPVSSPFGCYDEYRELFFDNEGGAISFLEYKIVTSPYAFITDSYINDFKTNQSENFTDLTSKEASLWQANNVYYSSPEGYSTCERLVVYNNRLLIITTASDFEFTEERINKISTIVKSYRK